MYRIPEFAVEERFDRVLTVRRIRGERSKSSTSKCGPIKVH